MILVRDYSNSVLSETKSTTNVYAMRRKMVKFSLFVLSVIVSVIPEGCNAAEKYWEPSLEWDTQTNWQDSKIFKNGEHLVFPEDMHLTAGLPMNHYGLVVAGIDFPWDGGLSLGKDGRIVLSEQDDNPASATWARKGPLYWADPTNWYSNRSSIAAPHLERIPCQDDIVVLPNPAHTLDLRLPAVPDTKVRSVRVKNDTDFLPPWEWQHLLEEPEFAFGPLKTVQYSGMRACPNSCPCQQKQVGERILREVCDIVKPKCPLQDCVDPVPIEGHCCPYCGGRVVLASKTLMSLATRKADEALQSQGDDLAWYTRRRWDSNAEVLIVNKESYSLASINDAVHLVASLLQDEGIDVLETRTAGGELVTTGRLGMILGPFFGVPLVMIIIGLILLPYFGYSVKEVASDTWNAGRALFDDTENGGAGTAPRRYKWSFNFARFENAPDSDVELAHPATEDHAKDEAKNVETEDGAEGHGGEFSNPLYRSLRRGPRDVTSFAELQRTRQDEDEDPGTVVDLAIEE